MMPSALLREIYVYVNVYSNCAKNHITRGRHAEMASRGPVGLHIDNRVDRISVQCQLFRPIYARMRNFMLGNMTCGIS